MQLVIDNSNYDSFLNTRFISGSFLQSSLWRYFLSSQGKRYWQLAVLENQQIIATCLLYQNDLPLGRSYLYAPKGPIFGEKTSATQKEQALNLILSQVRDLTADTSKKEEIFFKLDLAEFLTLPPELVKSADVQPRETWFLKIRAEAKDLMAQMHPKTRYNVSLAKRKGVTVEFSQQEKVLTHFLELIKKTAARNQISVHEENYYIRLMRVLFKNKNGYLALARLDQTVVAANILLRFGSVATYLHGASDYKYRASMAPHLLQWESIKKMQELGCDIYDFWGLAPTDGSRPKWEGLSRFKKSYGGEAQSAPGAYDLIYDQGWYRLYKFGRRLKNLIGR